MLKQCAKHGMTEFSNSSRSRCNKCMVDAVNKRRRRIKEMAIQYKGGGCIRCGYNKCKDALDFHHLDESKKDFSIGSSGYTRSWKRVKEELNKCVLLCANCHREVHAGIPL